jgi:hypothetical protein
MKNIIKLFIFTAISIFALHSPTTKADVDPDIERITVYGTTYEIEWIWEFLSLEYEYPYAQFVRDIEVLTAEQVLALACEVATGNKPSNCNSKPTKINTPRTNGCSSAPNGSFLGSCNTHDICYDNLDNTKSGCDVEFKNDLYDSCDDTSPHYGMNKVCKGTANIYYSGVVIRGNSAYFTSQTEARCAAWWAVFEATCGKI